MHQKFLYTLIALVLGSAGLLVVQMWTSLMPWEIFVKVLITMGIAVLVLGFLLVIKADLGEHKKLKDENYLD